MLKAIAKSFGSRDKGVPSRNWVIPVGAKGALSEQLDGIGAVRRSGLAKEESMFR